MSRAASYRGPSLELQRCCDEAVSFRPRSGAAAPHLRVARHLLTCAGAAAALNELHAPQEPEASYLYVNVHNPRCPLEFERRTRLWASVAGYENYPVWGINWAGAQLICAHLGARLPSAAEWECFAANNDPARSYPWGDAEPTHERANFGEHFGGPCEVGRFAPSDLGLYDLAGNLCEWCSDDHNPADGGVAGEKIVKGGAWSKDAQSLRITQRRGKWARLGTTTIGIRPVWADETTPTR